jgi:hypothetical protein
MPFQANAPVPSLAAQVSATATNSGGPNGWRFSVNPQARPPWSAQTFPKSGQIGDSGLPTPTGFVFDRPMPKFVNDLLGQGMNKPPEGFHDTNSFKDGPFGSWILGFGNGGDSGGDAVQGNVRIEGRIEGRIGEAVFTGDVSSSQPILHVHCFATVLLSMLARSLV